MRIEKVRLADTTQRLPMPDRGGRLFDGERGERVDVESPFWLGLIEQGAVLIVPPPPPPPAPPRPKRRR